MRAFATVIPLFALVSGTALAQTTGLTDATTRGISCWAPAPASTFAEDLLGGKVEVTAGDAELSETGDAVLQGPLVIRSATSSLSAESATYDSTTGTFAATGGIEFLDGASKVSGDSVSYDTLNGLFRFERGSFVIPITPARGSAESIEVSKTGYLELEGVRYTSCPEGNDDWILKASSIEIDADRGMGTARGASLAFKGVPFIYLPYFTYPVTDKRKSGLLFPQIGTSDQRGFELETPVYWNIRPNMDATIIPRYMSERGLQLGSEYRFLTANHEGDLWGDFLSNDNETGDDRWRYDVATQSYLPWGWRNRVVATGVSDDFYFEDMSSSRTLTSQTNLDRRIDFERYTDVWSLFFRVQDFQTIDPEILAAEEPYAQLPQFVADGVWRDGPLGLDYGLETEAVYFYRPESTNGARFHVQPEISLPLNYRGIYLTPQMAYDYTGYQLQDQPVGQTSSPSRSVPIASINTGAIFDRLAGKQNQLLVTLEPRAQYTYIPFENQSDLPIFDTIAPDFNLIQLFRKNRFIGYDRLGDTNQLSVGISSRVLDSGDGRELLAVTVGQTRYFEAGRVTLPGADAETFDASDYIAELDIRAWQNWNAGAELQWDSELRQTERASVRVQWRPGEFKALNAAYRYVRESAEQFDFSAAWPIGDAWKAIGRYNYSVLEGKPLDRFIGVEYESCCWAIRLLGRKSVARSTGDSDTSISFQFELKGFSNLGSGSIGTLERDILGNWTQ